MKRSEMTDALKEVTDALKKVTHILEKLPIFTDILENLPFFVNNYEIFIPGIDEGWVSHYFSEEKGMSVLEPAKITAGKYEVPGGWYWLVKGGYSRSHPYSSEEIAKKIAEHNKALKKHNYPTPIKED